MDQLTKESDDEKFVVGILFDFWKVFDTSDHDILLYKFSYYVIRVVPHLWSKSQLSFRQQFVTYKSVLSSVINVKYGVPQESNLGPIVFLIHITDLVNVLPVAMICFLSVKCYLKNFLNYPTK